MRCQRILRLRQPPTGRWRRLLARPPLGTNLPITHTAAPQCRDAPWGVSAAAKTGRWGDVADRVRGVGGLGPKIPGDRAPARISARRSPLRRRPTGRLYIGR